MKRLLHAPRLPVGRRFAAAWVVLFASAAMVACGDDGPEGPGSFNAAVETAGAPVGAVVVDVTGPGITGFEGTGDTRVFSTVRNATGGVHRVIAVSGTGSIGFRVLVERRELGAPGAVVIEAASTDDAPLGPAGITVRVGS